MANNPAFTGTSHSVISHSGTSHSERDSGFLTVFTDFKESYNRIFNSETFSNSVCAYLFPTCESTMDIAKQFINSNNDELSKYCFTEVINPDTDYILIFALEQKKGRGRRDREWVSAPSGGMYLTIVDRKSRLRTNLSGLSLALGYAIYDYLKLKGLNPALKWPNDVLNREAPHKKLSGILIETFPTKNPEECNVLSGIGLNINQFSFPEDVPASSMAIEKGINFIYPDTCLFAALSLVKNYENFMNEGFLSFKDSWWKGAIHNSNDSNNENDISSISGFSTVECEIPPIQGKVVGISDDGSLLVNSKDRIYPIFSGNVNLKYDL